jgi:predicted DNA-binding transcriptional regulator AlpA
MEKILELLYLILEILKDMSKQKIWLSPKQLEDEYGLKQKTMDKYRMDGRIPYYKIGAKFVRYKREEIDEWISSHKVVGLSDD